MASPLDRLRTALADRYLVEREIDSGGMATVYAAQDRKHKRRVAIKLLNPELAVAVGGERFLREIVTTARLRHPNILPLYDSGEADGLLYYVMPFVEGGSLRDRLRNEKQLSVDDAVRIGTEVGEALQAAHEAGVVHRDIKPENILLERGHAVVADFGIARAMSEAGGDRLTRTGVAVGTPEYMSPEQVAGEDPDRRSDLYSLGCVLFEMLAGEPPFTGPNVASITRQHLVVQPRPVSEIRPTVPPHVVAAISGCLSKVPADRPSTVETFLKGLREEPVARRARSTGILRKGGWLLATAGALGLAFFASRFVGDSALIDDSPLAVAVFPFRPLNASTTEWTEQLPDLLATVLDGTPGVRVADPWSLWSDLRQARDSRALGPRDPAQALGLASRAGASRFVLGTIAGDRDQLSLTVRLYRAGLPEPLRSISVSASVDSIAALVQRVAVALITEILPSGDGSQVPGAREYGTESAEALKAFLEAREAQRGGRFYEADEAIDRALAADSTFALALVEAVVIKSWVQSLQGQLYTGLIGLAERALQSEDPLSERSRLLAESVLASVRTDGTAAAQAMQRLVELDPTDLKGWSYLTFYHTVYGWQYGATGEDAVRASDRVIELDSAFVPGLLRRTWLALTVEGADEAVSHLQRLQRADATIPQVRANIMALKAVLADEAEFRTLADSVALLPQEEWMTAVRYLRAQSPARAEALMSLIREGSDPGARQAVRPEQARLFIAEGRLLEVDSALAMGDYEEGEFYKHLHRFQVAANLAGVGHPRVAENGVEWLSEYIPLDSTQYYWETRPVWWSGWLIAAHHAEFGDTIVTRAWYEAIGNFPGGGTPLDYRQGLRADLDARLAVRRG
ncbi:MAG: serine/threonine protein kinase, partial [Gemmatimonadota bacterium]|nr:serine/threonine protein kinase [Gemmatimonadota bacterium]